MFYIHFLYKICIQVFYGLLTVGLFLLLFWGGRWVPFNENYLSLPTSKQFKGWFSLVVIFYHLITWGIISGVPFEIWAGVGYLAVAVFLFFSGYGCQKRHMTVPHYEHLFLKKRLSTLFVPYFVVTGCYVVVQSFYGVKMDYWRIIFPFIGNGEPLIPYTWYIFVVALFYLVFYGAMKWFGRNYKMVWVGVMLFCVVWSIICQTQHYHAFKVQSILALPLGVLWAWKEKQLTLWLSTFYKYVSALWILGFYLTFLRYLLPGGETASLFWANFCSLLCIFALFLFSVKFQIGNKILSFLGNIYLEIYLIHGLVLFGVYSHYSNMGYKFVWEVIVLAGSIVGAYALHLLCKKPLQTYLQNLKS